MKLSNIWCDKQTTAIDEARVLFACPFFVGTHGLIRGITDQTSCDVFWGQTMRPCVLACGWHIWHLKPFHVLHMDVFICCWASERLCAANSHSDAQCLCLGAVKNLCKTLKSLWVPSFLRGRCVRLHGVVRDGGASALSRRHLRQTRPERQKSLHRVLAIN